MRKLKPTDVHEWVLRKTIKKPKPIKIMTCTSWKKGYNLFKAALASASTVVKSSLYSGLMV